MPARSVRLSFAIVTVAVSLSGSIGEARQGSIRISYAAPQVVAHQAIYETLRQRHVLERIRDNLQGLRLPRPLTLKVEGCNGDVNAAYEPSDTSLTICHEYLDYIQELSREIPPAGVKERWPIPSRAN